MSAPSELGRRGEDLAAEYLRANGWRILERGFRLGHREIDLVAVRRDTIAFVEVKTRRGTCFGHPLEAITPRKRAEIERVARAWIAWRGRPGESYRFDAVSIVWPCGMPPAIEHLENAWTL